MKLLRVRLKAADREALGRQFGRYLAPGGLLIPSAVSLEPATEVAVELTFRDGEVALAGQGRVRGIRSVKGRVVGLELSVEWDADHRESAERWALEARAAGSADKGPDALEPPDLDPAAVALGSEGSQAASPLDSTSEASLAAVAVDRAVPDEDAAPKMALPRGLSRTEYRFAARAPLTRDEIGPSAAPTDAFSASAVVLKPLMEVDLSTREPGEVTPVARIELVRRSAPVIRPPSVPPLGIDAARAHNLELPSKKHRPLLRDKGRRVAGVDLGSGFTRAAFASFGEVSLVSCGHGLAHVPSVVFIEQNGRTTVGEPAARKLPWRPELGVLGTTRLLGRLYCSPVVAQLARRFAGRLASGDESEVALAIGEQTISFEAVSAVLFKEVMAHASRSAGETVNRVVLTCPSSFGIRQREALRLAGELAGLHVERVISAPLAAAVAFAAGRQLQNKRVLVLDMGAGTLDVAVVEGTENGFVVRASGGDPMLGGVDLDEALAGLIAEEVKRSAGEIPRQTEGGHLALLEAAELGKWALGERESALVHVEQPVSDDGVAFSIEVEVHQSDAEARFAPLVDRALALVTDVCRSLEMAPEEVDHLLLVGGATRLSYFSKRVQALCKKTCEEIAVESCVVSGAAFVASAIEDGEAMELTDVLASTLGVGSHGGSVVPLVERGAQLPVRRTMPWDVRSEADLDLFLFQGDTGSTEHDDPLMRLRLMNLPPDLLPPFSTELTLSISVNGLLSVTAVEAISRIALEAIEVVGVTRELLETRFPASTEPSSESGRDDGVFGWLFKKLRRGTPREPALAPDAPARNDR